MTLRRHHVWSGNMKTFFNVCGASALRGTRCVLWAYSIPTHRTLLSAVFAKVGWFFRLGRGGDHRVKRRRASWPRARVNLRFGNHAGWKLDVNPYIMCSIRVLIYTAEKSKRRILANILGENMTASGMLIDKSRNVMDET